MQFDVAHFGDLRLDQAGDFSHYRVKRGPRGISVRRLGGNRAGEVRIGRFLRNGEVAVEKIVDRRRRARLRVSMAFMSSRSRTRPVFETTVRATALSATQRLRSRPSMALCSDWLIPGSFSAMAVSGRPRRTGLFMTSRASAGLAACRPVRA